MLSAQAHGLGASRDKLLSEVIVIRDHFGSPVVLVIELTPGLMQTFTLAHDKEFKNALRQYGVDADVSVRDIRI